MNTRCKEVHYGEQNDGLDAALPTEPFRLFVACPNHPDQAAWETRLFEAAAARGCEHVVKISTASPVLDAKVGPHEAHRAAEASLEKTCASYTILRPSLYMETVFDARDPAPGGAGAALAPSRCRFFVARACPLNIPSKFWRHSR